MNHSKWLSSHLVLPKADYEEALDLIVEDNRQKVLIFSALAFSVFLVMTLTTLGVQWLERNTIAYLTCMASCVVSFVVALKFAKGRPAVCYFSTSLFIFTLLGLGVFMGTVASPDDLTVGFIAFILAVPLAFTDRPIRLNAIIVAFAVIYLVAAKATQTPLIFEYNLFDVIPYGIMAMIITPIAMNLKVRRQLLEKENKYLSRFDQMTELLNRRSFDEHIAAIESGKTTTPITVFSMDLNGLKVCNDTRGHAAGDELIKTAAANVVTVFGDLGKCYRAGGDEFQVIIEGAECAPYDLAGELKTLCEKDVFHISIGFATTFQPESIHDTVTKADKAMYADKAAFYSESDNERRKNVES